MAEPCGQEVGLLGRQLGYRSPIFRPPLAHGDRAGDPDPDRFQLPDGCASGTDDLSLVRVVGSCLSFVFKLTFALRALLIQRMGAAAGELSQGRCVIARVSNGVAVLTATSHRSTDKAFFWYGERWRCGT